jgi:hypothetical protein
MLVFLLIFQEKYPVNRLIAKPYNPCLFLFGVEFTAPPALAPGDRSTGERRDQEEQAFSDKRWAGPGPRAKNTIKRILSCPVQFFR